jgi:SAM-dependent methyltransferase
LRYCGLNSSPSNRGEQLTFRALDPDRSAGAFAGEVVELSGRRYRHRPLGSWLELAERLGCRLHTPEIEGVLVRLAFSKLAEASWHDTGSSTGGSDSESYGQGSAFARVQKLEEPAFLLDYLEALGRVGLAPGSRVLSLGVGRGDELIPFETLFPGYQLTFTGVDHSASALAGARERFSGENYRFIQADLNALGGLEGGRYDLVVSIATFQSPGVGGHTLIREVVQRQLSGRGAVIIALPNCRYRDGEVVYGAKMKNFARPDLSLVVKDLAFYRKYLQQHEFRVAITGKTYLFLTAVRP